MSLFTYYIRVWGVAAYTKYLSQIDRLLRRAFDLAIFNTYDVTAAILMSQNNETENMLVFQVNPVGFELFSYVTFFCSHKFA